MIYASSTGLVHLIASVLALFFGTWVIAATKGTSLHKKMGYAYTVSMTVLIVTAFMTYRMFGGFGIFHWAAVVSSIALLGGIVPAAVRRPADKWLGLHYNFMFWSVMGLYAAFVAEVLTRVPRLQSLSVVFGATFAVMGIANLCYLRYKKRWKKIEEAYFGPK